MLGQQFHPFLELGPDLFLVHLDPRRRNARGGREVVIGQADDVVQQVFVQGDLTQKVVGLVGEPAPHFAVIDFFPDVGRFVMQVQQRHGDGPPVHVGLPVILYRGVPGG